MYINFLKKCSTDMSSEKTLKFSVSCWRTKSIKRIRPMKKLRKEDIDQGVFDLYDAYAHNQINRRQFIDKLSTYAVGGITVMSLMSFMMPDYKNKIQVRQEDPRVKS